MENKQIKHSYGGMRKDITQSKFSNQYYFEGKNIKLTSTDTQSTGSISNIEGNELLFTIPTPVIDYEAKTISYNDKILIFTTSDINYNIQSEDQYIIASVTTRDDIILLTTDNNGIDCIWKVNSITYDLTLLYLRNLNFSTNNPPQIINNFENELVDKIYWVDGNSQMRFLNLKHSIENDDIEELIDIPVSVIDMVGEYDLSQPIISNILTGGNHTSGMIQYAYNLYRLNSSQTKISPLSELISLDKGSSGGGKINELVGSLPIVDISNIDHDYTHIKVYAIKYTSYNEIPSISLIDDRMLPQTGDIQVFDDGNIIETISLDEFLFLGSDIIIPKHINTKFNRLFLSNYKEINFNVDLDCRAYSFNNSQIAKVYKDLTTVKVSVTDPYYPYATKLVDKPTGTFFNIVNDIDYDNPILLKHDSINLDYNTYKFQKNGTTYGGEGKYLKYQLTKSTEFNENNRYFKDGEIYRLGIEFFNSYGQISLPLWIADFKALDGNLEGQYNTLSVTLKSEFFTWLNTTVFDNKYNKPVGYKILIAERTLNDRTIIANGLMSPMMINDKSTRDVQYSNPADKAYVKTKADSLPKLPNILLRNYNKTTQYGITQPLRGSLHMEEMNNVRGNPNTEIMRSWYGDRDTAGRCYQFNSMLQLYSPEILFDNSIALSEGSQLVIKGSLKNSTNNAWARTYNENIQDINDEGKLVNALSPYFGGTFNSISGDPQNDIWSNGLLNATSLGTSVNMMFDRVYGGNNSSDINTGLYQKSPNIIKYDIYGKPELVEKGQSGTTYNNDPKYRYLNSLKSVLTDGKTNSDDDGKFNKKIVSINSFGNRCINIVTGSDNFNTEHFNRPTYESLGLLAGITGDNNGLIGEIVKSEAEIYLGNIYGGNSYEDKRRTNYIEIGEYSNFNELSPTINISSPGDTYVNFFKFARIVRTDEDIISEGTYVLEELITYLTETTVDLKNRSDISFNDWDSKFQPLDSDYHNYNRVYSQQPSLIQRRNLDYNIKKINNFDTNIISSKLKSAGELIDNWTDLLPNETLTLDGKYGPINSLVNFNDEIYALQDSSLSFISINPRVQVQGEDGLSIELGSGNILDRYKYISTTSGTLNKWSVIPTPSGLYYYDLLNKTLNVFSGQITKLSDVKGLHIQFNNNTNFNDLKIDNPLFLTGICGGYDYINNNLYMTFKQSLNTFTIYYNEMIGEFISFKDGIPSLYINKGDNFLTTDSTNRILYKENVGEYNKFYGQYYPSYVILNVNPEADLDTVFDNIMYKSEVYLNDIDQPDKTLTKVRLYSEYQDSGLVPLIVGRNSNLRRKFRDWNAILPRNQNSRERIRNPWVKLVLQFDNTSNYKLILHDIVVSYSI
jgi:hypothetical protein